MSDVSTNYQQVLQRIAVAANHAGRQHPPQLLAVSKKHAVEKIKVLSALGQRDFGESYAQEGVDKIRHLSDFSLVWHFIGPIQSNKTKIIAEYFDWIHSVDRMKILKRLSEQRTGQQQPLNVLLQLKIGDEPSKSGASYENIMELAEYCKSSISLQFRGLMCIPPPSHDGIIQKKYFQQAKTVFDALCDKYAGVDTLSMGMSNDLEAAIETGSTMVRVGTDIFGQRA